jgi:MFS family permease
MAATFLLASLSTSRLLRIFGTRVLAAGAILQAVGLIILGATVLVAWPAVSVAWVAPGMAVAGLGQGLVMSPLFGVVLSEVPRASAGAASGVLTTTQQVALALGVATLGSLFIALAGDGVGMRDGFLAVVAVQVVIAAGLAIGTRRLPGWRARSADPDRPRA